MESSEKRVNRVQVMMSDSEMDRVDRWRGAQKGVPSRSETMRWLVAYALDVLENEDRAI